jgi:hexosaminidase
MASRVTRTLCIDVERCPRELRAGIAEIQHERPQRFAKQETRRQDAGATKVAFVRGDARELSVGIDEKTVTVRYPNLAHAFRALGRLLGDAPLSNYAERCRFEMLGAMVDVSRNGVLRVDTAKAFLRRLALMGFNMCLLYAEDTYEIPGEPYFGYLRGRYSQEELQELDGYAANLGIEMFACIQALGHLEQILKWPAYRDYQDVPGVLIAEEEQTYALLEKMIAAASSPFRSKRIHIGMDEAHGVGTGRYKAKHGEKRPFDVLNTHLVHVRKICAKLGLRPMIWSDMYFRLGSKNNDYYDKEWSIPPEVVRDIPKDVELVYWDYYHTEQSFYEEWIERHRKLGSEPLMAGGVWSWNHFWAALPWSFACTDACMKACKAKNLKQVFVTMWGDDGMECDVFSTLPGIQYFAEHGYNDKIDPELLRANFAGSCEANFDRWVQASGIDPLPNFKGPQPGNLSKWMLWQDPLLSVQDPKLGGASLRKHFTALERELRAKSPHDADARLEFPAQIARVLATKCDLRKDIAAAYKKRDRRALERLVKSDLTALRRDVETLWKVHRALWMSLYKPFGWEVIDVRYGGLLARLETLHERLRAFIRKKIDAIPELEAELLPGLQHELSIFNYDQVKTPSSIK